MKVPFGSKPPEIVCRPMPEMAVTGPTADDNTTFSGT
jgi:hypothetical protein